MTIRRLKRKKSVVIVLLLLAALVWSGGAAQSQAADPKWDVKYWNNKEMSGDPVLQREESSLNYDWGHGSPVPNVVNSDNFSARWKRMVNFNAGTYRFTATMDDGMRVYVDNVLIIDSWWDSQEHSMSRDIYLTAGDHEVRVRYYDAGGEAIAKLSWTLINGSGTGPAINWKGEYYNNLTLSGIPILTRDDPAVNFDWGTGSPAWNVVAADQFSARWTRNLTAQPGRYRFTVIVDDGARLWVNGQLILDRWHDSNSGTYFAEIDLPGGSVPMQMEYFENMGGAVARLSWERIGGGSGINSWRGEYFNNRSLSGTPAMIRDDANLNFNWGTGSPASGTVNSDGFSVRWTRSLSFNPGRYRFTATSDDGVRVWVSNRQIIDAWSDHETQSFSGDIDLSGTVPVRVEYYENTGGARIQLSWTQITAVPQPTPPPANTAATGTVLSARLNVRHGPGTQYGVITQLVRGQTVSLGGYRSGEGTWVMINWNGSTAWVSGLPAYLSTSVAINSLPVWQGTVPGTGGPVSGTAVVANCYYLNMRSGPGVASGVVRTVPAGTIVTLLGRNAGSTWLRVQLNDGATGWMGSSYLNLSVPLNSLPVTG